MGRTIPDRPFSKTAFFILFTILLFHLTSLRAFCQEEPRKESTLSLLEQIQDRFPYVRFRGHLKTDLALEPEHMEKEWQGHSIDYQAEAYFETRFDLTDALIAVTSGRFNYYLTHDGGTDTWYEATLHEAYVDALLGHFNIRIGKQIVTWGKTDIISPLDNLNPLDLRYFIDPLPETIKIPILMAKVDYLFGDWTLEGVYIPFFEPSKFDFFGSDYSILKHQFPGLHFGGILGFFEQRGWIHFPRLPSPDAMDPQLRNQVNDLLRATDYPRDNFLDGEYGMELKGTWKRLDAEISYLYTWDDFPTYWIHPLLAKSLLQGTFDGQTILEMARLVEEGDYSSIANGRFHRMHIAGGGVSTAWKQFTFRGEGAYFHKRTFYNASLQPFQAPVIFYVLGADYTYGDKYIFHLQGFHYRLLRTPTDAIGIERDTYGLTFFLTGMFLESTLIPEFRIAYFLNDQDILINPRITYSITDHLSVSLGANILEGRGPNRLTTLRNLLRITPVSYFSDNDAVYISLKYSI